MTWRRLLPTRREAAWAGATAALFALAFPPVPLVVPAFLCLIPFALGIAELADGDGKLSHAFRLAYWAGAIAYGATLYWIALALAIYTKLAILGYAAAVLLVLAPVVGLGGAFLFEIRRRTRFPLAILLPVAWVTVEMLLMHISDLSFPWLPLGLSLARTPVLAQPAELFGVHGLSFWIAATNGLLADAWLGRRRWQAVAVRLGAVVALVAAVWLYGNWRMANIALKSIARVAIVQPNVPQEDKWQEQNQGRILGMLLDLTRQAVAPRCGHRGAAATRALARGLAAGIPAATSRMGDGRRDREHAKSHADHLRRARPEFPRAGADGLFQRRDAL